MAGMRQIADHAPDAPPAPGASPDICLEFRPRCLLTKRSALQLFAVTSLITFSVAAFATARGAWPVLLFAGMEMAVLYAALQCSLGRARDYERIEISDSYVRVQACARAVRTETLFVRYWARVRVQAADSVLHPNRLFIECQGRRCELGAFLTDAERTEAAARLRQLIGAIGQSPDLHPRAPV